MKILHTLDTVDNFSIQFQIHNIKIYEKTDDVYDIFSEDYLMQAQIFILQFFDI